MNVSGTNMTFKKYLLKCRATAANNHVPYLSCFLRFMMKLLHLLPILKFQTVFN